MIAVKKDGYIRLKFDSPIEHYGIRVFYTSSSTPSAVQLSFDTSDPKHFEKGGISYLNGGSAGYISYVNVYGLENESNLKFIVIKTSSEGELYDISVKTNIDSL